MAEYKFLSETETEEDKIHQYSLEVKVDLGDDDTRTYVQDVVFEADKCQEKAQEYADQMEKDLKEQKENGTLAPAEGESEAPAEETNEEE